MSVGIDGLSSYNQMLNTSASKNATVDRLQNTITSVDKNKATDEELLGVCKDFEAYLVEQVFKSMKKMVPKEEEENQYMELFGDTMYQEYAKNFSETGELGIAQMLYESMKRQ